MIPSPVDMLTVLYVHIASLCTCVEVIGANVHKQNLKCLDKNNINNN